MQENIPEIVDMICLLNCLRYGYDLDYILKHQDFSTIFKIVQQVNEDADIDKSIKFNSALIHSEILERFPIEKFPEKYI